MKKEFLAPLNSHEKLLHDSSWEWMYLDDKTPEDQPHTLLIALEEIDSLSGSLGDILIRIRDYRREYKYLYDSLEIIPVSIHRGCGDYDHKTYLVGRRKETSEELNLRLSKIKEKRDLENKKIEERQKAKEDQEKKEYLKLKEKFEKSPVSSVKDREEKALDSIKRTIEINEKLNKMGLSIKIKGDK